MSEQFQVRINGALSGGHDLASATVNLARLFRIDDVKAAALLSGGPRVVKTGLDAAAAEKYRTALLNAGVQAEVLPAGITMTTEAPVAHTAAAPQAPSPAATAAADTAPAVVAATSTTAATPHAHAATSEPQPGLAFRIEGRPDFAMLTVALPAGETIKVEAAAMAAMDTHLQMKTKLGGGFKRLLTGENIFINEFTAAGGGGEISISPASPGDVGHVFLRGNETIYLQNSAFLASGLDVNIETKWQGLVKGFFSGEALFLIRASGTGDLWFNTYGAMIELNVDGHYVVDTGNIVAFTEGLEYEVSKVGGYKSLFFSGEGFVCRFKGKGKVWIQTRGVQAFAAWASVFRPAK